MRARRHMNAFVVSGTISSAQTHSRRCPSNQCPSNGRVRMHTRLTWSVSKDTYFRFSDRKNYRELPEWRDFGGIVFVGVRSLCSVSTVVATSLNSSLFTILNIYFCFVLDTKVDCVYYCSIAKFLLVRLMLRWCNRSTIGIYTCGSCNQKTIKIYVPLSKSENDLECWVRCRVTPTSCKASINSVYCCVS